MSSHRPHMVITIEGPPDNKGRQPFTMEWTTEDGCKRGQCFRAVLSEYTERFGREGQTYEIRVREARSRA